MHLVFVTKYRRGVLTGEHLDALRAVFASVCADFGAELVEMDGQDDHVHLLAAYPPQVAIARLVNSLKGVSARQLRQRYRVRTHREHLWSPSYFAASAGGAPLRRSSSTSASSARPDRRANPALNGGACPRKITVNSNNNAALGLVLQGGIDLSNNFLPGIATLVKGGYQVQTYFPDPPYMLSANTAWLVLNTTNKPMDDPAFRKALASAIDVDKIVNGVYGQIVRPADPTGLLHRQLANVPLGLEAADHYPAPRRPLQLP